MPIAQDYAMRLHPSKGARDAAFEPLDAFNVSAFEAKIIRKFCREANIVVRRLDEWAMPCGMALRIRIPLFYDYKPFDAMLHSIPRRNRLIRTTMNVEGHPVLKKYNHILMAYDADEARLSIESGITESDLITLRLYQ